jgi:pimeloyl-ACP methyl ester carboxylesterase
MTSDPLSAEKLEMVWGQLSYQVGGAGKPLLVIHGLDQAAEFAGPLSNCCRVLLPSLPGFGESTEMAGEHTNNKLAWALLKFADALKLEQFDLLACGLGSAVGAEMIRRRPAAIHKLVLVEPYAQVKLFETLPGVMWIKHFLGQAAFSPRAGREWLLDSARYDVRKSLGARLQTALVISERTGELVKPVCEFVSE